ncbi:hypothetical protein SAMN04488510_12718 [Fervidobacterium changbaicum]|uniref:Uncharacterized protein n=1 Tax=Fervidobacterium changbaicum TaxID=310769 RepID=A0ABX5QS19_9BACT|nr:hypothetical protein [Fervidobacterium changbaicum]QAV33184.1 hypothetical protein CBS1_05215 [Fervidobacterium changbaicum]SDH70749.1 hypothetical protein SAMN04488510_12718 [Fervidobacterium changbaicum]
MIGRFVDYIIEVDEKNISIYFSDDLVNKPVRILFLEEEVYKGRLPHALFLKLDKITNPELVNSYLRIKIILPSEMACSS